MKVIFHPHAIEKLKNRDIDKSTVKEVIENPDDRLEGKHGRKIAQKVFGRYIIRAIYEEQQNSIVVITGYRAKTERYTK